MKRINNPRGLDQARRPGPGADQYAEVGKLMADVAARVKRIHDVTEYGVNPGHQHSAVTRQVADDLAAIDAALKYISELVEESAAAVEALEFNAEQLAESVASFKAALAIRASKNLKLGADASGPESRAGSPSRSASAKTRRQGPDDPSRCPA